MRGLTPFLLTTSLSSLAQAAAPVFTYGPASNYRKAPAVTATPTKNDLLITPTDASNGIPAKGIDFFLGPDLQASLKKTLGGVCAKDKASKECLDELSVALNKDDQYTIETRVVGTLSLLGTIGAAIVGLGIGFWAQDRNDVSHFHLESSDIAQIRTMTGSTAVIATSTGATNHVTVTIAPTSSTSMQPAKVTTLSADASGHHKGDVMIALPTQPADLLEQLLRKSGAPGRCKPEPGSNSKRQSGNGPNFNAINSLATFVLPMAAPGQLLRGLGLQALDHLPQLKASIDQASLETVQTAAAALNEFKDVAEGLRDLIAEAVWVAAYDMCVYDQATLSTLVLEDSMITDDPGDDQPKKCSTKTLEKPSCSSPQCAGENGLCKKGDETGCQCLGSVQYHYYPGDEDFFETSYQLFTEMFELKTPTPVDGSSKLAPPKSLFIHGGEVGCGRRLDQGNATGFVTLEAINSAADEFCKQLVAKKIKWAPEKQLAVGEENRYVSPQPFVEDGDNKVLATLGWLYGNMSCPTLDLGGPGAMDLCKARFGEVINTCDTGNPKGVKRWKQGGWFQKDCVRWFIGASST